MQSPKTKDQRPKSRPKTKAQNPKKKAIPMGQELLKDRITVYEKPT
jgi:hypothetical protein